MNPVGAPISRILRLEGLAVAIAGLLVWAGMDGGWWWFALLILVPDVSFVGYVWGNRVGAAFYNFAHSYALPLLLAVGGVVFDQRAVVLTGVLWLTHIGVDRALGYGLKYASGFQDTHLGRVGRQALARHSSSQAALAQEALVQTPLPQAVMRTGEHLAQLLNSTEVARSSTPSSTVVLHPATQHTVAR